MLWPLWPFTTAAAASTRSAGSARATWSRAASAASTSRPTTAASRTARPAPHPVDLFRELGQLTTVELAIAIGVELHGMLDKTLGRGWPTRSTTAWPTASRPHAALTAARPGSALTGPARPPAFAVS